MKRHKAEDEDGGEDEGEGVGRGRQARQEEERLLLKLHSHRHKRLLVRVRRSRLFPLSHIISSYCNKELLFAFMERWHLETNSFHFQFGEMTITLDDVPQLVGLQVEGLAMHIVDKMREECFAMETFSEVLDGDSEERVNCCAWAYLLYHFGSTLFANKTGRTVSVQFLTLLEDLGRVRDYAWGVGGLGHLYRQLGQVSRRNYKQLSGYTFLLERSPVLTTNSLETLPALRPGLVDGV
ncbi:protein MAINTENANCE OF MERISTEMS-like [Rhododendron vialii]|uniref:protein MAINTENANCE OF MERISTEMS-like n=1 Tax=Rhododendron vialii TaxID=182163 RepID=UPI00265F4B21|nr:protein MAINTENANCE OF MERISTEMS-like [Rhododendron vialii]